MTRAVLNVAFIDYSEHVPNGHFTLRRLERVHGRALIRDLYRQVADAPKFRLQSSPPA